MTKEKLRIIAEMVQQIINANEAANRSGPSFKFEEAIEEAIDRAHFHFSIEDEAEAEKAAQIISEEH